jgi:hypothetical protein
MLAHVFPTTAEAVITMSLARRYSAIQPNFMPSLLLALQGKSCDIKHVWAHP